MSEEAMFRLIAVYPADPALPGFEGLPGVAESFLSTRRAEQLRGGQAPDIRAVLEVRCRTLDALDAAESLLRDTAAPLVSLRTREHYLVDRGVTAEAVKGVFFFRRLRDLRVPDFQRYWLETHGPIASRTPGIQRYVQCHVLPQSYADGEPAYDGVTELYWPDQETTLSSMASSSMTEEQAGDAPNFVAQGSVELLLTRELRL